MLATPPLAAARGSWPSWNSRSWSSSGEHPSLTNNPYGFSKECAQVLTLQLSKPLGDRGIRIDSACPSIIETPVLADFKTSMGEPIIDWMVCQSGGRHGAASEVASVLAFLGSDAARYVTRIHMLVDNGFTAAILTGQADYSTMPTVHSLLNTSATSAQPGPWPGGRSALA